jgi:hypothetical protein
MNTTAGFAGALARVNLVETSADDNRGVPIIEVAITRDGTQPSVGDAEQLGRLLTIAPHLYALVVEATEVWPAEFDAPPDVDRYVSGADLIDWFDSWRSRAKEVLANARVARIGRSAGQGGHHTPSAETHGPLIAREHGTSCAHEATPR